MRTPGKRPCPPQTPESVTRTSQACQIRFNPPMRVSNRRVCCCFVYWWLPPSSRRSSTLASKLHNSWGKAILISPMFTGLGGLPRLASTCSRWFFRGRFGIASCCLWDNTLRFRNMLAFFASQLGKYVPGKAMVVVIRTDMVRGDQVKTAPAAASVFVETLTWLFVGAAIGCLLIGGAVSAANDAVDRRGHHDDRGRQFDRPRRISADREKIGCCQGAKRGQNACRPGLADDDVRLGRDDSRLVSEWFQFMVGVVWNRWDRCHDGRLPVDPGLRYAGHRRRICLVVAGRHRRPGIGYDTFAGQSFRHGRRGRRGHRDSAGLAFGGAANLRCNLCLESRSTTTEINAQSFFPDSGISTNPSRSQICMPRFLPLSNNWVTRRKSFSSMTVRRTIAGRSCSSWPNRTAACKPFGFVATLGRRLLSVLEQNLRSMS